MKNKIKSIGSGKYWNGPYGLSYSIYQQTASFYDPKISTLLIEWDAGQLLLNEFIFYGFQFLGK